MRQLCNISLLWSYLLKCRSFIVTFSSRKLPHAWHRACSNNYCISKTRGSG